MSDKYYTVKEVSTMLSVAEITVRQWIQKGKIESIKLPSGRARRIPESEVDRFKRGEK